MKPSLKLRLCGVLALLAIAGSAQAATPYATPTLLDRAGFANTQLWDISNSGVIVGVSDNVGFTYDGASFATISKSGALSTSVTGIADNGTLVGSYEDANPANPTSHGFIYSGGSFTHFDVAGAVWTIVRHISDNGRYLTGDWRDGTGVNNGFAYDTVTTQTWLFPADGGSTIVQGANDQGLVTGSFLRPVPNQPTVSGAFTYDVATGTRTEYLAVDGLARPRFRDINDNGVIAGFEPNGVGFVGTPDNLPATDDMFEFAIPGASSTLAYGLNDAGTVVGFYQVAVRDANGVIVDFVNHGWLSTPVPEPTSWALVGLALLATGLQTRRRAA